MPMTAADLGKLQAKIAGPNYFAARNQALARETPAEQAARNKAQIANRYAGGGGYKSLQHDIAVDQAQRIAGLNPEEALRGPRFSTFGGKTFQTESEELYGTFSGDVGELGKLFEKNARGGDGVSGVLDLSTLSKEQAAAARNELGVGKDSRYISTAQYLNKSLARLTDAQREQVLQASGLTIDQFTQRFGTGNALGRTKNEAQAVEGYDPNAYQLGTHRLRESIGQAQASRGLYGSMASASAEAAAVSALQGAQRQATNPFLLSGIVNEERAGVPGFFGQYRPGAGGLQNLGGGAGLGQSYGGGYYNAAGEWVGTAGSKFQYGADGQITGRGLYTGGAAAYDMNNPLAFLQSASATYAAAFGAR